MNESGILIKDSIGGVFIKMSICKPFLLLSIWLWVGPCLNIDITWVIPLDPITLTKHLACWSLLMLLLALEIVTGFKWNVFQTLHFCLSCTILAGTQMNQSILIAKRISTIMSWFHKHRLMHLNSPAYSNWVSKYMNEWVDKPMDEEVKKILRICLLILKGFLDTLEDCKRHKNRPLEVLCF